MRLRSCVKDSTGENRYVYKMKKITNAVYDKLANAIDEHLLEEFEITIDASKTLDFMNVILNAFGLEKE